MTVEFGAWTIAVVGIVGAATLLIGRRWPFAMLAFLILLVPFRDYSTRWMNVNTELGVPQVTAIGRWWFVVIFFLLALSGGRWIYGSWKKRMWPKWELADLLLALIVILAIGSTLASPNISAAVTSLRGYLQPLGVYFLARLICPARKGLRTFLMLWLVVGLIIGGFALWQATIWTESDYRSEGYVRQDGDLVVPYTTVRGRRYLRPASTVSGPNELAVDMVLVALLSGTWLLSSRGLRKIVLGGPVLVSVGALAATVSRSAFLGFLSALAAASTLYWGNFRDWISAASRETRARSVVGGIVALAVLALVLGSFGIFSLVRQTLSRLTQEYHFRDSVEAIEYLVRRPQGVGMGLVEPKGALSLIEAGGAYHVEGSIFQIAMEMGVWGLAVWLAFWTATLARIWRNWHALRSPELKVMTGTAFAGWLGSLVAFLFLPLMQSISLMVWLWFLLGIGYASERIERSWGEIGDNNEILA